MRWKLKTGFTGEIFDRKRSRAARLPEYLLIYANDLPPEHRTASNELIEFLENPNPGQTIVYFGLSYYEKPCGFATLMPYQDSGIGIVDHITPDSRAFGFSEELRKAGHHRVLKRTLEVKHFSPGDKFVLGEWRKC